MKCCPRFARKHAIIRTTEVLMPKSRSTNSKRKPPEPSESHAEIEQWMARAMPELQPIVKSIDEAIRKAMPKAHFAIKWKKVYYGLPDKGWVIELVAYDVSVNVVFLGGADFDTPPPLGEGDKSRYVKVKSLEEAETKEMKEWIEQAATVEGWK